MRILPSIAILHYTLPPATGVVENVIQAQARAFIQAGYPLALIGGCGQSEALPLHSELIVIPELDPRHPRVAQMNDSLANGEIPESFTRVVEGLVDALHPVLKRFDHVIIHDVFTKHSNLALTAAVAHLVETGAIRHAIAWSHDSSWTNPGMRENVHQGYPWDLLRTAFGDVTYVTVSERQRQELAGLFHMEPEAIHLAYDGVEPRRVLGLSIDGAALVERLGLLESDLVLLMPVRIARAENIEYALNVLASMKMLCRNPRLVVTGALDLHGTQGKEYFQSLRALRDRLGVTHETGFVFELGPDPREPYMIPDAVASELLRVSDIVFMPSHRESFGMQVLEAGLAGIPVVSTNIPASVEIGKQDVFVFSPETFPQELADQMLSLISHNPISRFRRRLRQHYTRQALFHHAVEPLLMEERRPV